MVDVFEEVEEQLRADRYRTLAVRYLPWIGGALLAALIVAVGFWGYQKYQQDGVEKASQAYASGLTSLAHNDRDAAFQQFAQAASSSSGAYKTLALMQQAGIRMSEQRTADAVSLFDQAAQAAPNPVMGDAVRLESAYLLLDTASLAQIEDRLKPLTSKTDSAFNALAREAVAMAKLRAGQTAAARSDFIIIALLPSAPESVRQRAQAARDLIDSGSPGQVAAIVKGALALPPAPLTPSGAQPMGPGAPPPGAESQDQAPADGAAQ